MRPLLLALLLLNLGCRELHGPLAPAGSFFIWNPTVVDLEGNPIANSFIELEILRTDDESETVYVQTETDESGQVEALIRSGELWAVCVRPSSRPDWCYELALSPSVRTLVYPLETRRFTLALDVPDPSSREIDFESCRVSWRQLYENSSFYESFGATELGDGEFEVWYHESVEVQDIEFRIRVDGQSLSYGPVAPATPWIHSSYLFPLELLDASIGISSTNLTIPHVTFSASIESDTIGAPSLRSSFALEMYASPRNLLFQGGPVTLVVDDYRIRGSALPFHSFALWDAGTAIDIQLDAYILEIQLRDEASIPIASVDVGIEESGSGYTYSQITGSDGSAKFMVQPGVHAVRIFFSDQMYEDVVDVQGNMIVPVVFDLSS